MEYTNTACETNSIELSIYVNDLTNPYLEFTLVDGTIKNTDILSIIDSFISYEIPFEYYSTNGTINMRIRAEGYNSNYIGFTIPNNLSSTDNVIVKIDNEKYLVKTIAPYKYHDLPPVTLYSNTSGTQGSITLSDDVTNYTKIEILASITKTRPFVKTLYTEQLSYDSTIEVTIGDFWHDGTSATGMFASFYTISGKNITYVTSGRFYQYINQNSAYNTTNSVYIHKVLGYK